mgnify:CR=1 FL=1
MKLTTIDNLGLILYGIDDYISKLFYKYMDLTNTLRDYQKFVKSKPTQLFEKTTFIFVTFSKSILVSSFRCKFIVMVTNSVFIF